MYRRSSVSSLLSLLLLVSFGIGFAGAQSQQTTAGIESLYSAWQPEIPKVFKDSPHAFMYVSGAKYEKKEWTTKERIGSDDFLAEKVVAIGNLQLGYFIYREFYTPSGDWFVVQEDYFDKKGYLFLVDWSMNTFQATNSSSGEQEPVSVHKRLYFASNGVKLKETKEVFKMNTKEPSKASFADRNVDVTMRLSQLEFFKLLNVR